MHLKQINENVFVIQSRTINLGLIVQDKECIVIDTGLDKTSGQMVYNLINEMGLQLQAIINTHGHADHFGGNQRLVKLTNAPVYSSAWEINFLKSPMLEPFSLFCGVNPPQILKNKFYMAPSSPGEDIFCNKDFINTWGLEIVPLPGHTLGMIGIIKNDVFFVGDAYFCKNVLDKHPVPFLVDVDALIETLAMLKDKYDCYYQINSHQGIYSTSQNARQIIDFNINRIEEIYNVLEKNLDKGLKTSEELVKAALEYVKVECRTYLVYHLIIVTVNAYLASLLDKDIVEPVIRNNILYWSKVSKM
ncbi:MBL fold metallo-hydrolase [Desulfitibacter alkalitolerans]|uniref:MBL fold metallo-hydrolase n=1 Tax=Desulfitibacter alkalitolerans TaxID=264641 RepID=UPI00048250DA|nr:MBL fold metallo-hydrolase [Desulfitibacter alkalitolerans]